MDLQVFQIDMSRDTQRVKFMPLETAMQRTGEVDASLYPRPCLASLYGHQY